MPSDTNFSVSRVLKAGIVAGVGLGIFQAVGTLVLSGPAHVLTPLRMIAAIALGPAALDPGYSPLVAMTVGLLLHLTLSMVFALIFAALVPVSFQTTTEVELGMAYGFLAWIFNFYLIAPALGWVWFAQTNPLVQLAAHTIGFGAVVGWFRHHAWEVAEAKIDSDVHEFHALN
jgi:uncharacterized membrane protein YagU involved in acid resistance